MLSWIISNAATILLVLALILLLIWAIVKLVKYYRSHICDWAAKRLAKCVPAEQCNQAPLYLEAKRCPQQQISATSRPVVQYAPVPQVATTTVCAPVTQTVPVSQYATAPQYTNIPKQRAARPAAEAKRMIPPAQVQEFAETVQITYDETVAAPSCAQKFQG
ncbi:MAG: hypothetical protein LBS72_05770 [Oscillospiraceae bacterium]|jgi:hypothetical protein|nr:hypothetical protein [Oscillospiraceae bacterium]